jgi:hypothetical protein
VRRQRLKAGKHPACRPVHSINRKLEAYATPELSVDAALELDGRTIMLVANSQIGGLCSEHQGREFFDLLRQAQQFTVNVFDNVLRKLIKQEAVKQINKETDVLFLV